MQYKYKVTKMNDQNAEPRNKETGPIGELRAGPSRRNNVNNVNVEISIDLPIEGECPCPVCGPDAACGLFLEERTLNKHLKDTHGDRKIAWRCRECQRSFSTYAGTNIHKRSCKGAVSTTEETGSLICEGCQKAFKNSQALASHEISKHPEIRNRKRLEKFSSKDRKGRPTANWSEADIEQLRELDR